MCVGDRNSYGNYILASRNDCVIIKLYFTYRRPSFIAPLDRCAGVQFFLHCQTKIFLHHGRRCLCNWKVKYLKGVPLCKFNYWLAAYTFTTRPSACKFLTVKFFFNFCAAKSLKEGSQTVEIDRSLPYINQESFWINFWKNRWKKKTF